MITTRTNHGMKEMEEGGVQERAVPIAKYLTRTNDSPSFRVNSADPAPRRAKPQSNVYALFIRDDDCPCNAHTPTPKLTVIDDARASKNVFFLARVTLFSDLLCVTPSGAGGIFTNVAARVAEPVAAGETVVRLAARKIVVAEDLLAWLGFGERRRRRRVELDWLYCRERQQ